MITPKKKELKKAEIRANYVAFTKMSFDKREQGKYALLRKGKLVKICDIHSECCILGNEKFADGLYSVQEIGYNYEEDLGFVGCVLR